MPFDISSFLSRLPLLHSDRHTNHLIWVGIGTALALGSMWTVKDKHDWEAFGTGGTKPSWYGYLRNNFVLRTALAVSFTDLTSPKTLNAEAGPSYLQNNLPERKQKRPAAMWTLPQRQRPGHIDQAASERIWALTEKYTKAHSALLKRDLSATEGRSTMAIYAKSGLPSRPATATDPIIGNEIAHVHPQESSLHVWLSEADCAEVVRKGWGERFPLSCLGKVHPGFTFVYAPQAVEDVAIIEKIVEAGIQFVTGESL